METQDYLNYFARTTELRPQEALNILAGTSNMSKQHCWNVLARTTGLSSQAAANAWARTPSPTYLSIQDCCRSLVDGIALNNVNPSLVYQFYTNRYVSNLTGLSSFPFSSVRTTTATMFDASGSQLPRSPFFRSPWQISGAGTTVTQTSTLSPSRSNFAKLVAGSGLALNGNDGIGSVRLSSNLGIQSGDTWSFSFFASAAEIDVVRIREEVSSGYRGLVNLITGEVVTESGTATLVAGMVVTSSLAAPGVWHITCRRTSNSSAFNISIKPGATTGDGVSGILIADPSFDAGSTSGRLLWSPHNQVTRSGTATAVVGSPGVAPTGWGVTLGLSNGVTRSIVAKGTQDGIDYMDVRVVGTFTGAENITITPAPGATTVVARPTQTWCGSCWWALVDGTLPAGATPGLNGVRIRYGSPSLLQQDGDSDTPRTVWARYTNTRTAPASTTVVGTDWVWSFGAGATVDFTVRVGGFQLELADAVTPKAYIETTGSAIFHHRLDADPTTGAARGLLIEAARTNDIANGTGTPTGTAATVGTGSLYLGGWQGRRITANGTSAAHFAFYGDVTPTATQARRACIVARMVTGTRLQVAVSTNFAAADVYVNVNMSTGAVVGNGAGATNIVVENLGNSVRRISFDFTSSGTPAAGSGLIVGFIAADGDLRLPTNTSTDVVDVMFAENCAGSGVQSIVPSFSTATTRGQDSMASVTGLSSFFPTGFTLYAEYLSNSATSAAPSIVCLGDGVASGDEVSWFEGGSINATVEVKDAGVNVNTATAMGAGTRLTTYRLAATVGSGANANRAVRNGGAVTSKTPTAFPVLDRMSVGSFNARGGSVNPQASLWIREVRIYPATGASDAQLQALTA